MGPGAPAGEVPGAANTIQSGRAMLVSLLARSSAGGTVSPALGGPRRRAAYLGDSWKGTERAQWRGRQRQVVGVGGARGQEIMGEKDPDEKWRVGTAPPTLLSHVRLSEVFLDPTLAPKSGPDSPILPCTPQYPSRFSVSPSPSLTSVLFSMVSDQLPQLEIPSDHCHLGGVGWGGPGTRERGQEAP